MKNFVQIIIGSKSDFDVMRECCEVLEEIGLHYRITVCSAHRTPEYLRELVLSAEKEGAKIFIAGAGGAAHLAGVVSSFTVKPVIGVPLASTSLNGLDSLLSMVQMPKGVPVATVSIGSWGARNAGILAAQILGTSNEALYERLKAMRQEEENKIRSTTI